MQRIASRTRNIYRYSERNRTALGALMRIDARVLRSSIPRSLATCIAAAMQMSALAAPPSTAFHVTDCGDAGPGTLRDALGAGEQDVDVSACTQISLVSGQLDVSQDTVQISGSNTRITSMGAGRVLSHTGSGSLRLFALDIADGYLTGLNVAGGCIYSRSNVTLYGTKVHDCTLVGTRTQVSDGTIAGGGVFANGSVSLYNASVRDNTVTGAQGIYSYAQGGGIFTAGNLFMSGSTISGNTVTGSDFYCRGGGAEVRGNAYISYSTISANAAPSAGGASFGNPLSVSTVVNSTISGNSAHSESGGLASWDAVLRVWNSTVAFNQLGGPSEAPWPQGAGILTLGHHAYLALRSSIIAGNDRAGTADDLSSSDLVTIVGNDNLVVASKWPLPPDTITVAALLMPLADNGGLVATHALQPGSPAIDHGDNFAPKTYDARGPGFDRVVGSRADMGAYEVQTVFDSIFADGFDAATGRVTTQPAS